MAEARMNAINATDAKKCCTHRWFFCSELGCFLSPRSYGGERTSLTSP
jgi:hypothetical protein